MADARDRTLLDFAIAASVAVVPVMLGILLLVAVIRPADRVAPDPEPGDRYVSVRQLAALKTFEHAVVRRDATPRAAPAADTVLAALPQCRAAWAAGWGASTWRARVAGEALPSQAQQIAARLAELDAALLRFSTQANTRVEQAVALDARRWFEAAAAALEAPFETPAYPGQRFRVGCEDLAAALSSLVRGNGRLLDALAWRGTEQGAALAHWRPEQMVAISPRQLARRNPWNGVAGCIYLGAAGVGQPPTHFVAGVRSAQERLCALPAVAGASAPTAGQIVAIAGEPGADLPAEDPRWMVPPSLQAMLQPLEGLRRPSGALYRLYTELGTSGSAAPGATPGSIDATPSAMASTTSSAAPTPSPADLPTAYRYGPNRVRLEGTPVDIGFSVDLTIDPALQALAQKTAACYTGRQDVCRALGIQRAEDRGRAIGHRLLETAMVRMAAVAVVDVASGRIEALAGALSPCARQAFDGPGRGVDCDPRLPYPVQYRPDALLNPAVFHDAMPASTIKPIMAAAFLADRDVGARWLAAERAAIKPDTPPARDSLRGQLMRSDSARFLDRMFCFDRGFADCHRPWDVQSAALAFGWNGGCDEARVDCGKQDLLFGRAVDATAEAGAIRPLATTVAYGRLMAAPGTPSAVAAARQGKDIAQRPLASVVNTRSASAPGAPLQLMPADALNPSIVRRCAFGADGRRLSDDDWEKCRGGSVVDVVAEGWGQGHARSSALGVAGMMATLAAAANGQAEVRRPHLVQSLRGVGQGDAALKPAVVRWSLATAQPHGLSREVAEVIVDGLSYSHRAGTARSACEQVFDARSCRGMRWLAGKTGTPSFRSDGIPLPELARLCSDPAARGAHPACGSLRPYKWYVAAYRSDAKGSGPWTKVIGVLTERNWLAGSGQVHASGDRGPNPAAEIAMQITGRQLGLIAGAAP